MNCNCSPPVHPGTYFSPAFTPYSFTQTAIEIPSTFILGNTNSVQVFILFQWSGQPHTDGHFLLGKAPKPLLLSLSPLSSASSPLLPWSLNTEYPCRYSLDLFSLCHLHSSVNLMTWNSNWRLKCASLAQAFLLTSVILKPCGDGY